MVLKVAIGYVSKYASHQYILTLNYSGLLLTNITFGSTNHSKIPNLASLPGSADSPLPTLLFDMMSSLTRLQR